MDEVELWLHPSKLINFVNFPYSDVHGSSTFVHGLRTETCSTCPTCATKKVCTLADWCKSSIYLYFELENSNKAVRWGMQQKPCLQVKTS